MMRVRGIAALLFALALFNGRMTDRIQSLSRSIDISTSVRVNASLHRMPARVVLINPRIVLHAPMAAFYAPPVTLIPSPLCRGVLTYESRQHSSQRIAPSPRSSRAPPVA